MRIAWPLRIHVRRSKAHYSQPPSLRADFEPMRQPRQSKMLTFTGGRVGGAIFRSRSGRTKKHAFTTPALLLIARALLFLLPIVATAQPDTKAGLEQLQQRLRKVTV